MLSLTRNLSDFVVLETLLNLFAILLPSASTSKGDLRNVYIRDVFSDKASKIASLLDSMSNRDWDATATKVIDILAASDIKLCVTMSKFLTHELIPRYS